MQTRPCSLVHHYKPRDKLYKPQTPTPRLRAPASPIQDPQQSADIHPFENAYLNSSSVTPRSSVIAANLGYENEGVISIID